MADRFWVGNGGNTNDTAHWSTTSGGAGGASVPTATDKAKFDANSFTLAGQIVTIPALFSCLDMDWTGATNNPTLAGSSTVDMKGSLIFIPAMTVTWTGVLNCSFATNQTLTTAGKTINNITIAGTGGIMTLQDDVIATNIFGLGTGSCDTNNKNITCSGFSSSSTNVRSLTLGSSVITITGNGNSWDIATATNLTLSAGTSSIVMTNVGSATFAGGGKSYNKVVLSQGVGTITGSNTIATLVLTAGKTLKPTSGTNQTVSTLVSNGTLALPLTIQSTIAGSPATITLPAARHLIRHTSVKDITISGATSLTDIAGTDAGGNTGITFSAKFEMGRIKSDGSLNWYSAATGTSAKVSG